MKNDMMWAYLMHLSTNMWGDVGGTYPYSPYFPTMPTDDETWRKTVEFLPAQGIDTLLIDVGDAVEYERHPEISIPGAWSKDKMKKELDYIRSLGLTPLPKLNFSACHDAWLGDYQRMLSTPKYYEVCKDCIEEVAELFDHPAYFHLGLDEETAKHQRNLSYCCVRQGDLWWHDAYFLFDVCEKQGSRPWMWADYCWDHMDEFIQKMPKSVLQSNWYYHRIQKNADGTLDTIHSDAYRQLDLAGFDQVPTSSCWAVWYNTQETMDFGKELLDPQRLKGYMTAPWYNTLPEHYYNLLNDAFRFGLAKKQTYPEYCK